MCAEQVKPILVENFSDVSEWMPVASGEAQIILSAENDSLRIDFDFKGGGGFVVARKQIALLLPEMFSITFRVRGDAPANKLELKLVDSSGKNVWRWQDEGFAFTPDGRDVTLRASQIPFAWGPAGGGVIRETGAVEFVLCAPPGGKGVVWLERFRIDDCTNTLSPVAYASGFAPGTAPEHVLAPREETIWRAAPGESHPWLMLDFQEPRESGGLVVSWADEQVSRAYSVEVSNDLSSWRRLYAAEDDRGALSFIPLPDCESRYLRLTFTTPVGVRGIEVQPYDFARSPTDFFHSVAAHFPRGWFPRYMLREQSFWTCVGLPEGRTCALINEEGQVEPKKGSGSIEPFIQINGRLFTWADAATTARLEADGLPFPTVCWQVEGVELHITCFASVVLQREALFVRYCVCNRSRHRLEPRLFIAIRPFQVNPPWQAWKGLGGVSPITHLCFGNAFARVNMKEFVVPLQRPASVGASTFEQGNIVEYLARDNLPCAVTIEDRMGYASGAMRFDFDIPAGGSAEIYLAVPMNGDAEEGWMWELSSSDGARIFEEALEMFRQRLCGVRFVLPEGVARDGAETFRTAAGHILINRDGPAIQPGPRRYTRSWIRDGVMIGAALHRIGEMRALRDFVEWYAPYQREDGFVPCCVDRDGADWLVEHDSHGQLIFGVYESFRFTKDRDFLLRMWPHIRRAAFYIETLRSQRKGTDYRTCEKRDRFGLLPESASHEGYLAHPVHSYWDDFWALRGLRDAWAIALELGCHAEAKSFGEFSQEFEQDIKKSLATVISSRGLDYIPGSVEWADFDPTATANAVALLGLGDILPQKQLGWMFELYMRDFRKKRSGEMAWTNYSAYEIRIIKALVRLGRRSDALELVDFFLRDRRPVGWNQWPEISWKDPRSPGHLGDVPHTWISSEWMSAFASLFAYEREADNSLVVGAGLDHRWFEREGIAVFGLPTWFGLLDLEMRNLGSNTLEVRVAGTLDTPPGGVVLCPPCEMHSAVQAEINGALSYGPFGSELIITELPAVVRIALNTTRR